MFRLLSAATFLMALPLDTPAQQPKNVKGLPTGAILRLNHATSPKVGQVSDAVYSPDGKVIATAAESRVNVEGCVTLWDAATGRVLWRVKTNHHTVPCRIAFAPDGKTLAGCGNLGFLRYWDTATGKETSVDTKGQGNLSALAFSPDGKYLATGALHQLDLWDAKTQKHLATLKSERGPSQQVYAIAFAPDGKTLVCSHLNGILFWDADSHRLFANFRIDGNGLQHPTFSPSGKYFAARNLSHALRLFDWTSGKEVRTMAGINAPGGVDVYAFAFSPDSHTIAIARWNTHTVHLYETATGRERACFVGHTDRVGTVAFAPHGRALVSASLDRSALVWDATGYWDGHWPTRRLEEKEIAGLWTDLASDKADKAYRAIWGLALSPQQSVPLLADKFFPKHLPRLIGELEDDVSAVRQKALAELKQLGPIARSALRRARPRLLEAKKHIQMLLDPKHAGHLSPAQRLQMIRALETLELTTSPLARRLLEELTREDWVAEEARAAWKRLSSHADH